MRITKLIDFPVFIISLCIGLFFAYIIAPNPDIIFVYPTPDNRNKCCLRIKREYVIVLHHIKLNVLLINRVLENTQSTEKNNTILLYMYIKRFIYSKFGRYVISILLGLGLATLFRRACKERNCLNLLALPLIRLINKYLNIIIPVINLKTKPNPVHL